MGTTVLNLLPGHHEITKFDSFADLQQAVLASCFIPMVWEEVIWLPGIGPCVDGGASSYMVDGDVVMSPNHDSISDVAPAVEFPRHFFFHPIDARDMLRLFEEGYRDCARWIDAGCPSKREVRQAAIATMVGGGVGTLLNKGLTTFLEVVGLRNK